MALSTDLDGDVLNSSDCGRTGISKATSPQSYQVLGSRHAIIDRLGPSVKLMGAAKMRMNIVLDLGSGELTFQKKASSHGTRIEKVQKPRAVSAVILVMGMDKRFAKPAISF